MEWILRHKILSLIIVVVVAVALWYFLSGSSSAAPPVLTTDQSATAPAGAQDLVNSLLALRAVTLDGSIFSNPSFQQLQDFSTPIVPEPVGRSDPFAPLGAQTTATPSSTNSAQIFTPAQASQ